MYCYIQSRPGPHGGDPRNQEIWSWVMRHLQLLPSSTTVLIMTDANGHVDTNRNYALTDASPLCEDARHPALHERAADYPHIGNMGAEQENGNGMHLRRFLEQTNFIALNTWRRSWAGPTYYGNGRGTRHPKKTVTRNDPIVNGLHQETKTAWKHFITKRTAVLADLHGGHGENVEDCSRAMFLMRAYGVLILGQILPPSTSEGFMGPGGSHTSRHRPHC